MKDLPQRTLTAIVFGVVMIGSILFFPVAFLAVFLLISVIGLTEFYKLTLAAGTAPDKLMGMVTSVTTYILFALMLTGWIAAGWLVVLIPLLLLIFIRQLKFADTTPLQNASATIGGLIYVTVPVLLCLKLAYGLSAAHGYNGTIVMGIMFLVWANDSGAYFAGSKFGKHRLLERVSPKKSWEGFWGGLVTSLLAAYIISQFYLLIKLHDWMIIAVLVTVFGTIGDLTESMMKRAASVKDSGNLLPGHGGILDRFDAFLMAVPFVFTYLWLTGHF